MLYPTMDQVETADRIQLARWMRHLPGPGFNWLDAPQDEFERRVAEEKELLEVIMKRFAAMGGMTPEISKYIGW